MIFLGIRAAIGSRFARMRYRVFSGACRRVRCDCRHRARPQR
jgi:hypothetical protein